MKNIHVLPTDKPSRLRIGDNGNFVFGMIQTSIQSRNNDFTNQHIYITSDEEIKVDEYYLCKLSMDPKKCIGDEYFNNIDEKKIILTTDQDLINDGVQAIDDEFLEWFVKNPNCEYVEFNDSKVVKEHIFDGSNDGEIIWEKKIIIPQEELKQANKTHYLDELPNMDKDVLLKMRNAAVPKLEHKQETLEEASLRIGLMEIELNHTKTLLASCEKALENRDNQAQRMYSEEEVKEILMKTDRFLRADLDLWFKQFKKK